MRSSHTLYWTAGQTAHINGSALAGNPGMPPEVQLSVMASNGHGSGHWLTIYFESIADVAAFEVGVAEAIAKARREAAVIDGSYEPPFAPGDVAAAASLGPRFDDPEFGPDRPVEGGR